MNTLRLFLAYIFSLIRREEPAPLPSPLPSPEIVPIEPPPAPEPRFRWDTKLNARHSVRVICDEEGLSLLQKNLMCQVIDCESSYNTLTVHPNVVRGKTVSTDYGICQWNDFYHGKEISPDEALHNPEKAVRLMCRYVRAGRINQWVCYSAGLYRNHPA